MIKGMFPPSGVTARGPQEPSLSAEVSAQHNPENPLKDATFSASPVSNDSPTLAPKTAHDVARRHAGTTRIGDTTINVEVLAA